MLRRENVLQLICRRYSVNTVVLWGFVPRVVNVHRSVSCCCVARGEVMRFRIGGRGWSLDWGILAPNVASEGVVSCIF